MIETDTFSLVLLIVTIGTILLMFGIAVRWRGVIEANDKLPFWGFVRVLGVDREKLWTRAGQRGVQLAEMRCSTCSSQDECAKRLAAGESAPAADCPNESLLGLKVDFDQRTPVSHR